MTKPNDPEFEQFVKRLHEVNGHVSRYRSMSEMAATTRKTLLEGYFEDAKRPQDLMAKAQDLAEHMSMPLSVIFRWLGGVNLNTGDTTIVDTDGQKIGVLYLADIFKHDSIGVWHSIEHDKIVWYMVGEYDYLMGKGDGEASNTGRQEVRQRTDTEADSRGQKSRYPEEAGDS